MNATFITITRVAKTLIFTVENMSGNSKTRKINLSGRILSPETLLKNLHTDFFGEKRFSPVVILITTLVNAFVCYFYHMIYGLGCPDTLTEGAYYYRNADYSTTQARWMLRYINEIFGKNVVIPSLIVLFYCLMIGISAIIICRIINLTRPLPQILLTTMMVSFPVILHHFAFFYMALAYSVSFLAVTAGCAFVRTRKIPGFIAGTLCFLVMLGSYQSYIGAVSALACILFIYDILNEKKVSVSLVNFLLCGAAGIAACLINMPFSRWMMNIHHVGADGRVDAFNIKSAIDNIGFSLKYSYVWFFSYFNNDVLSRNRLYAVIFVILGALVLLTLIKLIREKKYIKAVLFAVITTVLPIAMNLLLIIMPENGMRDILRYQYVLIFVLLFILHDHLGSGLINSALKYPAYVAMVFIFIGNVISANSTEKMYKLVYDHYEQQFTLVLDRIYDLEGYKENETRIVIGGLPSYEVIDNSNPKIFRYAEKEGGPVFWWSAFGMTSCREHYFHDFLGVNAGYVTEDEYRILMNCKQYSEMAIWPEEGSVQMIEGFAVVKFTDDPPQ